MENNSFSTNGAGTTEYPHAKKWSWTRTSHNIQKLTQNGSHFELIKSKS